MGNPQPGQYWCSGSQAVPHWGQGLKEGAAFIESPDQNAQPATKDYPRRNTGCTGVLSCHGANRPEAPASTIMIGPTSVPRPYIGPISSIGQLTCPTRAV